jgi:hypothetical protein
VWEDRYAAGPIQKTLVVAKGFQKVEEEEEEIKGIIITTRMGSMSNGYDNSAEQQHPPPLKSHYGFSYF